MIYNKRNYERSESLCVCECLLPSVSVTTKSILIKLGIEMNHASINTQATFIITAFHHHVGDTTGTASLPIILLGKYLTGFQSVILIIFQTFCWFTV